MTPGHGEIKTLNLWKLHFNFCLLLVKTVNHRVNNNCRCWRLFKLQPHHLNFHVAHNIKQFPTAESWICFRHEVNPFRRNQIEVKMCTSERSLFGAIDCLTDRERVFTSAHKFRGVKVKQICGLCVNSQNTDLSNILFVFPADNVAKLTSKRNGWRMCGETINRMLWYEVEHFSHLLLASVKPENFPLTERP